MAFAVKKNGGLEIVMKYFSPILCRKFRSHQLAVKGVFVHVATLYSLKVSALCMQTNVYVAHLLWLC